MSDVDVAAALLNLERLVAAVKGQDAPESNFAKAPATLKALKHKEGIPMAIVVGRLLMITNRYDMSYSLIDPQFVVSVDNGDEEALESFFAKARQARKNNP